MKQFSEKTHPREYRTWQGMKQRCGNPKCKSYGFYGGAGVKVFELWSASFGVFIQDMGACPEGFSIDRIDPYGDYEPSNCRWASSYTQSNNKRGKIKKTASNGVRATHQIIPIDELSMDRIKRLAVFMNDIELKYVLSTAIRKFSEEAFPPEETKSLYDVVEDAGDGVDFERLGQMFYSIAKLMDGGSVIEDAIRAKARKEGLK